MQSSRVRQAIVAGGLMVLFGAMMLVQEFVEISAWVWVPVFIVSGLAVYGVYSIARNEIWMLIVSYALLALGIMISLIELEVLEDSVIATYVLVAVAIPFVYGFFRGDRTAWGLLIPAYVLVAVGIMVPLIETNVLTDDIIPVYVMFAIALPFLVVFGRDTKQLWALIVGAVLAIAAISFFFAPDLVEYILPIALILVGGGILVRLITRREEAETAEDQASGT